MRFLKSTGDRAAAGREADRVTTFLKAAGAATIRRQECHVEEDRGLGRTLLGESEWPGRVS
ncbi:MAG: hypothetical protein KDA93_14125 [Planctomycetaceae bacterium]|nr:hypothetical protein [Planctomycetaceae bacterium]